MTTAPVKKARQMPKGGRKGGSVFPRLPLNDAVTYALKLVNKTHTARQPNDVILSGVIGVKGGIGAVRLSALKQYGFLEGDSKKNFSADDLAKKIAAAPPEELVPLYRKAMLKPTVFKKLFDTFHGDVVSKAKLKQRAADLNVHPEETATCVDLYVSGMTMAELVTVEGDQVKHLALSDAAVVPDTGAVDETEPETTYEELGVEESSEAQDSDNEGVGVTANGVNEGEKIANTRAHKGTGPSGPRAVFNVNVTLDSSLDIEKLQKQLELLKRFGAI